MCMRSVNATVNFFFFVKKDDEYISFSVPFDTIKCVIKNNIPYISDFFIVANLNLMGTTNETFKADNIVENDRELFCLLRLTKISKDVSQRVSWDIDKFSVDSSDMTYRFNDACVATVNYRKIVEVQNIQLTDNYRGDYALKLLVRTDECDSWEVQTIARLTVI